MHARRASTINSVIRSGSIDSRIARSRASIALIASEASMRSGFDHTSSSRKV